MATATELFGRTLSGESAELTYKLTGTQDDATAKSTMLSEAPSTHNSLVRDDDRAEVEETGVNLYVGRVPYKPDGDPSIDSSPLPPDGQREAFDISTQTQRVTQGRATQGAWDSSGSITSPFKNAINATADGVEGADIQVPVFTREFTKIFENDDITTSYIGNLFSLVGKMNNATFKGGAAHEALLVGVSGAQRTNDSEADWELRFRVAFSPNETGLSIGDISGIDKDGWDFLWVQYEDAEDGNNLVKVPKIVVVERVYEEGDFSLLNI